jgi:phosphopantothenoylcysteine decarboxylase/phosphopantothenate--cysteine ligase
MKVLLGVTGGIAAYKAVEVASKLVQAGHQVLTVMTRSAKEFVTPLTFQSITGEGVIHDLFGEPPQNRPLHITASGWADVVAIVPATANFIGKVAGGIADDALGCVVMAASCPVIVAPAMNPRMWKNPIVQGNIEKLQGIGYTIVPPGEGWLADGHTGVGRLADLDAILAVIEAHAPQKDQDDPSAGPLLAGP